MVLRPQDLIVCLKLSLMAARKIVGFQFRSLATEIGLSQSETHSAVQRALRAQLLVPKSNAERERRVADVLVNRRNLIAFVLQGVPYVWVPDRGPVTRGVATAHATAPLNKLIRDSGSPPVWPDPRGDVRGESFSPLHSSAIVASQNDRDLHAILALIDALRGGRARERNLAKELLPHWIEGTAHA